VTESLAASAAQNDARLALRNGAKLLGSLFLTLGIGAGVRLFMPRFLGRDDFGAFVFADDFTTAAFVLISLGVDVYIRKEVSVRTELASHFFGGVTAIRIAGALVLFGGMQAVLVWRGQPQSTWALVHACGVAQFLTTMNLSLAALLHARGTVNELSVLNVVAKLIWGAGALLTMAFNFPIVTLALAMVASELLKTVFFSVLCVRHLGLKWAIHIEPVKAALIGSLPMFVNTAAHTIYNKLDIGILALLVNQDEVAWYGAASRLAGVTMMIVPMIGWVLLPLFARARARSDEEYTRVMRRSLEMVLIIAFPSTLFLALGADLWISIFCGPEFAPAVASLQILAPLFVLTYVAIISASSLILTGRAWAQAFISLSGLAINPLLNWFLIPKSIEWFGTGGAGIGAAISQLGTEATVTVVMLAFVGTRAFDRRTIQMVLKTLLICATVVLLDQQLQNRFPAAVNLGIEVVVYLGLLIALRTVHVRETIDFARAAFAGRKQRPPDSLASDSSLKSPPSPPENPAP
jgi:O-antigen/teichoic acid export membrane protein